MAFGDRVEMAPTLREALIEIFGEAPETLEDAPVDEGGDAPERGR